MTGENPLARIIPVLLSILDYTIRVLGALMGLDGPAQPPLGPPPTLPAKDPEAPFQLSPGPSVPA